MKLIEQNISNIANLCTSHRVNKLFAIGSVLTPRFGAASDIDLVVDFKDMPLEEYADNYLELHEALETLFGREVDLLEERGIRNNSLRTNINRTKQLIYG